MSIQKLFPWILIIGSLVGLVASFLLTLDTIKLVVNPEANIPCNINPFVSCKNAALSWQGEVFGFPNSILGIIAFSMLLAVGVMLFSGGRARKPLWLFVNLGTLASTLFVIWFIYQSLYNLGTLCIYCMIVWAVIWPIFLYTTIWNFREDHFKFSFLKVRAQEKIGNFFNFISRNHIHFLTAWYAIIVFLIIARFNEYFLG
jgi:uncharacterized membrane protein